MKNLFKAQGFVGLLGILAVGLLGLQASAIAANCDPPPSGIVAWWPGEGNAADAAANNNGTLMNGAGFAPGEVGLAFNFPPFSNPYSLPGNEPFVQGALYQLVGLRHQQLYHRIVGQLHLPPQWFSGLALQWLDDWR